jgi:5'-deoxynucleotidase YfbR-like HD superfamily hydrolase
MFDARERMLGFVERWNVAPRLHRQSVAEHSFFVTLYASELGRCLGLSNLEMADLLGCALRHDMPEIITGDMPGPAKRAIADKDKLVEYEYDFMVSIEQTHHFDGYNDKMRRIIKAADTIDAYYWISLEVARGNQMMSGERSIAQDRMSKALRTIGLPHLSIQIELQAERLFAPIFLAPRLDDDLLLDRELEQEMPF